MQLAPLPIIPTPWFPIDGPGYTAPLPDRSGYYELQPRDGSPVEKRWFNGHTGNWMCVGGTSVWVLYSAWRGCTTPRAPVVIDLPRMPEVLPPKVWINLDNAAARRLGPPPALPPLPVLVGRENVIRFIKGNMTWTGKGRAPGWVREYIDGGGDMDHIAVIRQGETYVYSETGEVAAWLRK